MAQINRRETRRKVHRRIRRKIAGTAERPRLAVNFSNQHVYAQLIDDESAKTLAAASSVEKGAEVRGSNKTVAASVGKRLAERAKGAGIEAVVFDRGGFIYHGKVQALAEAAREGGLKF